MSDFVVTIDKNKFLVNTNHSQNVLLNGNKRNLEISQLSDHTFKIQLDNKVFHITSSKIDNERYLFLIDGHYFESFVRTKLEEEAANILNSKSSGKNERVIKSPMPGLIVRINKQKGDNVCEGEPILLLEAMKMENEIRSPVDGIILKIQIEEGNSVEKNQDLFVIKSIEH